MSRGRHWTFVRPAVAAVVLLATLCGPAASQDTQALCKISLAPSAWQAHPQGPDGLLSMLMAPSCLGDARADQADALVAQFNQLTPDLARSTDADAGQRVAAGRAALALLRQHAKGQAGGAWPSMTRHLERVDEALQQALASTDAALYQRSLAQVLPSDPFARGLDAGSEGAVRLGGENHRLLGSTECPRTATSCAELVDRVGLIRVVNLLGRLSKYLQADGLAAAHAELVVRNARWKAYREGGRHQYFWEVWLNGRLMECPQDEQGIPVGFCPVPTQQWLLLHPEAALVFNHQAGQSSDLQATLTVELLGYHRWSWADGNSAQMRKRWGVSLLAAYSEHDGRKRWGFGPKFVFGDGYHLGVTRAPGGRWSVAVNLPLSDALFGRKQAYTDYLKSLRKPGLGELW